MQLTSRGSICSKFSVLNKQSNHDRPTNDDRKKSQCMINSQCLVLLQVYHVVHNFSSGLPTITGLDTIFRSCAKLPRMTKDEQLSRSIQHSQVCMFICMYARTFLY